MAIQGNTITVNTDTQILAGNMGIRCPEHATIDPATVTADADGQKAFDAGHWVTRTRILPRTRLTADVDQTDTSIPVEDASLFVVGDALISPLPYLAATFSGTWAASDFIDFTTAIDNTCNRNGWSGDGAGIHAVMGGGGNRITDQSGSLCVKDSHRLR